MGNLIWHHSESCLKIKPNVFKTSFDSFPGSGTLDFSRSLEVRETALRLKICQFWTDYKKPGEYYSYPSTAIHQSAVEQGTEPSIVPGKLHSCQQRKCHNGTWASGCVKTLSGCQTPLLQTACCSRSPRVKLSLPSSRLV